MIPKYRKPVSPGEVLLEEFLKPLGMSQVELARRMHVPIQRVNTLINGKRDMTAETAILLARTLKTSVEFWMNLQVLYDIEEVARQKRAEVAAIHPFSSEYATS
jgi:addiction module HigA family antidote